MGTGSTTFLCESQKLEHARLVWRFRIINCTCSPEKDSTGLHFAPNHPLIEARLRYVPAPLIRGSTSGGCTHNSSARLR